MSKILVLGAGISGLIASIALVKKGINTVVVDKNSDFSFVNEDLRNIALTNHSKDFLDEVGIWSEIEDYVAVVNDIYVLDNKNPKMLHFSKEDSVSGILGHMIQYKHLHNRLFEYAKSLPAIKMLLGKRYTKCEFQHNNDTNVQFDDESVIKTDLILACDGKNSNVKKQYFKKLIWRDYKETALVFNISHSIPHNGTAIEHFTNNGTFAVLPLRSENESSIVWSLKTPVAEAYLGMSQPMLEGHILDIAGSSYGDIKIISKIKNHQLTAEITKTYHYKNIALISDSAHTIHPLAGQGLNQGIKDIKSIVEIISENKKLGLDVDSHALRRYEKSRATENLCMFGAMHAFDKIFVNSSPVLSKIRPYALEIVDKMTFLKKWCIN